MKQPNRQTKKQAASHDRKNVSGDSTNLMNKDLENPLTNEPSANNEQNGGDHTNSNSVKSDRNKNVTEIEIGIRANNISFWSAIVNACLFIVTLTVFYYTVKSTKAAIRSADFADSTFRETRHLFEVQNEPFLQINDFKIDTVSEKEGIKYRLIIKNLGNYPVKIVDCVFINTIRKTAPSFDSLPIGQSYPWLINKYIFKDNDFIEPMKFPLSVGNMWAINTPDFYLYTMGIIKYQNLVTKTVKSYKFQIQSQPMTTNYNLYLINENY